MPPANSPVGITTILVRHGRPMERSSPLPTALLRPNTTSSLMSGPSRWRAGRSAASPTRRCGGSGHLLSGRPTAPRSPSMPALTSYAREPTPSPICGPCRALGAISVTSRRGWIVRYGSCSRTICGQPPYHPAGHPMAGACTSVPPTGATPPCLSRMQAPVRCAASGKGPLMSSVGVAPQTLMRLRPTAADEREAPPGAVSWNQVRRRVGRDFLVPLVRDED
jgi:hypothetical protein